MPTISLIGVQNSALSQEDDLVHVTFATQYTGDYKLAFTRECREQLLAAFGAAPAVIASARPPIAAPAAAPPAAAPASPPDAVLPLGQVQVQVPKKWAVTAELKVHDVVLLLFDPKTEGQKVYALGAEAAKQMAGSLAQSADAVLAHKQAKQARPKK
jgi:hypothetical protein